MAPSLSRYNERAIALQGNPQFRAIVLSIHGVNTTGPWQKSIAPILTKAGFLPVLVDYGFNLARVLMPKALASRAKQALWDAYGKHFDELLPFSVIGHSFGTLAIGQLLSENPDAVFDRIVLAGSILAEDYPWERLLADRRTTRVLNEVSTNDRWVRLCPFLRYLGLSGKEIGLSGCRGFQIRDPRIKPRIKQRKHIQGHSGVLNDVCCKRTWVPFLLGEEIPVVNP